LKQAIKFGGCTAVIITVLASLALGQQIRIYRDGGSWVQEQTGDLGGAKNLRVKLASGSVQVQGGSQSSIGYVIRRRAYTSSEQEARRQFDAYRTTMTIRGDMAVLSAEFGGSSQRCSDEYVIKVPNNIDLARIDTGGGNVTVTGISGRVELETGAGNVRADNIGGALSAETGGGTMDVGSVGGNVTLKTGGGNVKIASAKGEIKAESGGGNLVLLSGLQGAVLETSGGSIHVDKCGGRVKASTGGGTVDLGQIEGPAQIETGAGSIHLVSAKGRVQAETGGGSIQLDGATSVKAETAAGGIVVKLLSASDVRNDSSLETAAGDITVYLANDLHIAVRAEIEAASGHTIRSDFPDIHVSSEGGPWARTVSAEGQLNGGGPMLKVQTTSGSIKFLRVSH
jgi:DUF4097 and DUF4098 domain-containing protein YvlB